MNKSSAEVATIFGLVILVLGVTSSQTLEGNIEKSNGNGGGQVEISPNFVTFHAFSPNKFKVINNGNFE